MAIKLLAALSSLGEREREGGRERGREGGRKGGREGVIEKVRGRKGGREGARKWMKCRVTVKIGKTGLTGIKWIDRLERPK